MAVLVVVVVLVVAGGVWLFRGSIWPANTNPTQMTALQVGQAATVTVRDPNGGTDSTVTVKVTEARMVRFGYFLVTARLSAVSGSVSVSPLDWAIYDPQGYSANYYIGSGQIQLLRMSGRLQEGRYAQGVIPFQVSADGTYRVAWLGGRVPAVWEVQVTR